MQLVDRIHMSKQSRNFTTVLTQEGKYFIAHNLEFGVVSQGESIEEATTNLKEAMELYLENISPDEFQTVGLHKPLVTTMELEYA